MTPEERAGKLWQETRFHEGSGVIDEAIAAIAAAIREAVEEERERRAAFVKKVIDLWDDNPHLQAVLWALAEDTRAGKETP